VILNIVELVGRSVEWVKGRHGNAAGSIVEDIATYFAMMTDGPFSLGVEPVVLGS
jgi:hypothetical protein